MRVFQVYLSVGCGIWLERTLFLIRLRQKMNMPWERLGIILGTVALITLLSALVFQHKKIKVIFRKGDPVAIKPAIASCLVTAGLFAIIQLKVKAPVMLLADRFLPGAGWVEILLLSIYAGWITEKIIDSKGTAVIRSRIWTFFSIVFFSQLLLGIAGIETLLMTGKLHLPVPAMIIAGPLFRGGGLFMIILFAVTVILIGSAWCSYLCYIGAWDNLAAGSTKKKADLPQWRHPVRIAILLLVIAAALLLRLAGVTGITATLAGATFGLIGVGIMVFISRKKGLMVHCISYCPIGLVANLLGKMNPFRIKITDSCTDCNACRLTCNYDALTVSDIKNRKAGLTCTLCGDCISACHADSIQYRFPGLTPGTSRIVFLVAAVSLHAVFIGVARL
jgi:NAD-dependent dihydropyrimidine dehydrogenase PreA subunit